ncbi:MAG: GTP-binding protein [Candidatus Odinarchaeia archaeon]
MIINWNDRNINVKIVYYGPAMSGKTTSIKRLFSELGLKDKVKSIETTTGRTLFFDFAPLTIKQNNWDINVEVWSATGQNYYAETRLTVLSNTDGIVFVADAQRELLSENKQSWRELVSFFGNRLEHKIPVSVCLNKYDLHNVVTEKELRAALNNNSNTVYFKMIATMGVNVVESFKSVLERIFHLNIK